MAATAGLFDDIPEPPSARSPANAALGAGDIDLAEDTPREWVKQILDGKVKGVHYVGAPHAGLRLVRFNVAAPPFDNKKLRQADYGKKLQTELIQAGVELLVGGVVRWVAELSGETVGVDRPAQARGQHFGGYGLAGAQLEAEHAP